MADNVDISAGTGTSIATDDAGAGGHVQVIKLAISTNGSATVIPADATNGLDVDVTRVQGTVTVDPGTVTIAEPVTVDGTVTVGTLPALAAGTNNIGDVDVLTLPSIPAGTNNIGDVDVLTLPALATGTNTIGGVIPKPSTSGGVSCYQALDLDESEEDIKGSAGQLYGWYIYNDAATEVYVKLYDLAAASVTVGSTTPVMTLGIPATSAANVFNVHGIAFATAICAAATTGATVADTGAPATNSCVATFFYS